MHPEKTAQSLSSGIQRARNRGAYRVRFCAIQPSCSVLAGVEVGWGAGGWRWGDIFVFITLLFACLPMQLSCVAQRRQVFFRYFVHFLLSAIAKGFFELLRVSSRLSDLDYEPYRKIESTRSPFERSISL